MPRITPTGVRWLLATAQQNIRPYECHNPVTDFPVPLRVLCCLTRGNRQLWQSTGGWLLPACRAETDGRGSQAMAWCASATGGISGENTKGAVMEWRTLPGVDHRSDMAEW
jgi:hypothetical protein